jgi:diguanylate cyclase (GGDEF)-like protein/PAS domain S-box-containing protein
MPKHRPLHKWDGIVFRSLAAVTLITVLLGGIYSLFISAQMTAGVQQEAQQRLGELLDTVESTASVAAFAKDEQLAHEVSQGLMRNSEVLRVVIMTGNTEIARAERSAKQYKSQPPVQRTLLSPFKKGEIIGVIRLEANWEVIFSKVQANARNTMLMLTGQMLLVIVGTAAMVYLVVVRPIKATSDRLHRMDAVQGGVLHVPEGHEHTEIGRLVGDINDLTHRLVNTLDQERDLRQQHEIAQRMYQDLFDHTSSGIFVSDVEGKLISFNPAFIELTWLPAAPDKPSRHLEEPGWNDYPQLLALIQRSAAQHISTANDFLLRGRRGDEKWLQVMILPLGDGRIQGTVTDITARKRDEISARRQAITDSLTGFANREGLLQAFATLDETSSTPFAVVMINLDGFKKLNDSMGFPVGDQVLLKVAGHIREAGAPGDFYSRLGGDEFVFALNGMSDRQGVQARIEALQARLCEPSVFERGSVSIAASLGIAFFPRDGADMPQLLRCAELALNSVRQSNRSSRLHAYEFFDPHLQAAIEHQRRLEDDLRSAVSGGELRLAFQPIINLRSGRLAGAEALLRWQHIERGYISPEVFIPLAERMGLIGEIGRQVLEDACRQLAHWRRDGLDIYVSVNVSASQIPNELPAQTILDALNRHGLPAQAIALEITEGVLMSDVGVAQTWIEQLRAAGMRIFLDDFGTGYSSLSYLKRFPLDTVKIDKSFVTDMNSDNRDYTLVDAIITMAGCLSLNVVAEGIEEANQLALLSELGCGYGQGYHFSRPVAAADFAATALRIHAELAESTLSSA